MTTERLTDDALARLEAGLQRWRKDVAEYGAELPDLDAYLDIDDIRALLATVRTLDADNARLIDGILNARAAALTDEPLEVYHILTRLLPRAADEPSTRGFTQGE